MFDLGPHAGFIWLSYLAAALCVIGLLLWVWSDERSQRRRLADFGTPRDAPEIVSAKSGQAMSETTSSQETQARPRSKALLLLPLVLVVGLLGLLYFALQSGDPSRLPSVLIGKPVPEFNLAAIPRLQNDSARLCQGFLPRCSEVERSAFSTSGLHGAFPAWPSTRNSSNSRSKACLFMVSTTKATRPKQRGVS